MELTKFILFLCLLAFSRLSGQVSYTITNAGSGNPGSADVILPLAVTAANTGTSGQNVTVYLNVSAGFCMLPSPITCNVLNGSLTITKSPLASVDQGFASTGSVSYGLIFTSNQTANITISNITFKDFTTLVDFKGGKNVVCDNLSLYSNISTPCNEALLFEPGSTGVYQLNVEIKNSKLNIGSYNGSPETYFVRRFNVTEDNASQTRTFKVNNNTMHTATTGSSFAGKVDITSIRAVDKLNVEIKSNSSINLNCGNYYYNYSVPVATYPFTNYIVNLMSFNIANNELLNGNELFTVYNYSSFDNNRFNYSQNIPKDFVLFQYLRNSHPSYSQVSYTTGQLNAFCSANPASCDINMPTYGVYNNIPFFSKPISCSNTEFFPSDWSSTGATCSAPSTALCNLTSNNTTNFNYYSGPISNSIFKFHTGYNINTAFSSIIGYSFPASISKEGSIFIRNTQIRASTPGQPIFSDFLTDISLNNLSTTSSGGNLATLNINYNLYHDQNLSPVNLQGGDLVIDFYKSNSNGDILEHLGSDFVAIGTWGSSYNSFTGILDYNGNINLTIPAGVILTSGDKIACTTTGFIGCGDNEYAGTSNASYLNTPPPCSDCISSFAPIPGKKYLVSAWAKENGAAQSITTYAKPQLSVLFPSLSSSVGPFVPSGAVIDGWQRIEGEFTIPSSATDISLKLDCTSGTCFYDDVRVLPFDGSMKSYVYDPVNMRLVAELDERNYATLYEYDEEGKLVRVKKETEKGIMTIQENRNNTKK